MGAQAGFRSISLWTAVAFTSSVERAEPPETRQLRCVSGMRLRLEAASASACNLSSGRIMVASLGNIWPALLPTFETYTKRSIASQPEPAAGMTSVRRKLWLMAPKGIPSFRLLSKSLALFLPSSFLFSSFFSLSHSSFSSFCFAFSFSELLGGIDFPEVHPTIYRQQYSL